MRFNCADAADGADAKIADRAESAPTTGKSRPMAVWVCRFRQMVGLEDPLAGWSSLLGILRTDGVMRVGLYSSTARREIVKAQEIILQHGYRPTAIDIRKLRHDRSALDGRILTNLAATIDFYSVSGCRDALFNTKEHNSNLLTINRFITENRMRFLGFSIDESILHLFRKRFPDNPAADDLLSWHLFEKENPDTFIRIYQFWI